MTAFRKISAASKGKLIRAYLPESTALDDAVDALHEACGPALAAISPQPGSSAIAATSSRLIRKTF